MSDTGMISDIVIPVRQDTTWYVHLLGETSALRWPKTSHPPTWYPFQSVLRQRCTALYLTHITQCLIVCGSASNVLFFEFIIYTCSKMLIQTIVHADLWTTVFHFHLIPTHRLTNAHIMVHNSGDGLYIFYF